MIPEQFDEALNEAVHAVLQAFGLEARDDLDLAERLNDAIEAIMRDVFDTEDID